MTKFKTIPHAKIVEHEGHQVLFWIGPHEGDAEEGAKDDWITLHQQVACAFGLFDMMVHFKTSGDDAEAKLLAKIGDDHAANVVRMAREMAESFDGEGGDEESDADRLISIEEGLGDDDED